jgi:tetratricopeptide (TPR) repeat protein
LAYKDLVIRLSSEGNHKFLASALEDKKPVASCSFELRLDELRITHPLRELEKEAINLESEATFHRDFGQELFRKVFAGELGDYFKNQLQGTGKGNGDGLRIGLQFDESASRLAKLPWEFLHDGENFLVSRPKVLFSRLPANGGRISIFPLESILRMLVIISAPNDPSCRPLNVEKERDRILQAVDQLRAEGKIEVDFTDDATLKTIQDYLLEKYHILHFTGHGEEKNGQGYLILETEDLKAREVDNQVVCDLFAERGIRLVVLSACKSADLAEMLVRKGVPAALAMQYSVLDESATQFAYTFYRALASGHPVDASLVEARQAMKNAEGANGIDFATPVLYQLDPYCLDISRIEAKVAELEKPLLLDPKIQVMNCGFVGRHRDFHRLNEALLSSVKRALLIYGWGGMGKTVLATRLATRLSDRFEGIYGHRCHPQTKAEDILFGLNSFLNMLGIQSLNQVLSSPAPISVKTAMLVRILNQRRFLVILDNFESCLDEGGKQIADPELRDFVSYLLGATTANTKYIITSRIDFDPLERRLVSAIEHYPLPEMPYYEAIWMMNNHTSLARLSVDKKKQIHKAVGGHPWSIDQFALQVSEGSDVDGLLQDLEPLARETRVFTLFDRAYSRLDDEAKELLLCTSVFEEAVPEEALRWMMGDEKTPSPPVSRALRELQRWGLAARQEELEIKLYSVHTLVRQFVQQEAENNGIDLRPLMIRAAQGYELQAKVNRNLWDHLRARDYYYRVEEYERAADIVEDAVQYLARWGYIEMAMSLLQQSADTTLAATKARATANLAILYQLVGDLKMAIKLLEEAKEILNEQGDQRNVAAILHQLGIVHQDQGNYPEAVKLYEEDLAMFEALDDKLGIASSRGQLGTVHYLKGNYPEAVKLYEESLAMFRALGDKSGIAGTLHQLGRLKDKRKDLEGALDDYISALDIFEELHDPHREIAKKNIARLRAIMGEDAFQKVLSQRSGSA